MKKSSLVLALGAVLLLTIFLGFTGEKATKTEKSKQEKEELLAIASPPPGSLDNLFPPKAEQPIFTLKMQEMGTFFSGIISDLTENDFQNVMVNFENFKAQYIENSKLVPEWEKYFPIEPVEELGAALKTGDQGKVMLAYERVGNICTDCHIVNMPKVQWKYHWQDFSGIKVKDPLTNEEVNFTRFMQYLDTSFVGILLDIQQNQKENARKQFQGVNARFQTLKETCLNCHNTERKYYTDESVQDMIDKLGQALSAPSVDPKVVEELAMGIGMESCHKCHLVHVPSAIAKLQWEKFK
ncbi:MAG: hypothetical protein AB1410_02785 [Acidobacteriota bacterium]